MRGPISPDNLGDYQIDAFPDYVFEAFNSLIAANWAGNSATVYQDDVIKLILDTSGIERKEVFSKGYLNVEEAYRSQGWKVVYDKPTYCENYRAYFKFSKKR